MARNWLSNGMQLVRVVMGLQHADYAALSHTVNFDKPAWPSLQHICLQLRGKGRAGAEFYYEAA